MSGFQLSMYGLFCSRSGNVALAVLITFICTYVGCSSNKQAATTKQSPENEIQVEFGENKARGSKVGSDIEPKSVKAFLPDTPVGRRAQDLIDMLNSKESGAVDIFIGSSLSEEFRNKIPTKHHQRVLANLKAEYPQPILRYQIAFGKRKLVLYIESDKNHRWVQLELMVELGKDSRIDNMFFRPLKSAPDPRLMAIDGMRLGPKDRELIVTTIGKLMIDNYVYPNTGQQVSDQLMQHLDAGNYDKIVHAGEFSTRLTDDIRKVAHDKHVRVSFQSEKISESEIQPDKQESLVLDHGLAKAELLSGNIGVIDLRHFEPAEMVKKTFAKAMKVVEPADAIVFDMRKNGGGAPEGVQLLCSYLFDERIHLNSLYWRKGDRTEEFWTLDQVEGRKRPLVPVFVVTSNRTFSGAEEFTYNIKTTKRGIIVGEVTGGGANPGEGFDVIPRMDIFVSTGRAINPITGTNWEGVGIQPDVKVAAKDALETALKLAREAAKNYSRNRAN